MSVELVRLFLMLTLLGQRPALQLFEVSAYSRLCVSQGSPDFGLTASGKVARVGMCALPAEFEFGTRVVLEGGQDGGSGWGGDVREVVCEDRGQAIRRLGVGVARLDLCFVGLGGGTDGEDEEAAVLWGRRLRWGLVVRAGATSSAAQVALVRGMVEGRWVENKRLTVTGYQLPVK